MINSPNEGEGGSHVKPKHQMHHQHQQQHQKQKQRGGYNLNDDGDIDFQKENENENGYASELAEGESKVIADESSDGTSNNEASENAEGEAKSEVITDDDNMDSTQKGGARKIAELRNRISERFRRQGIFFGPLIIDLNHNNSAKLDPTALPDIATNTNIHINYVVTDKTDGERYLLFIDGAGNAFGIDRESNIKSFGISMPALGNTILDGEFISRTEDNKVLNNFYIFDAYIYKGESVIQLPFLLGKTNGRHNVIQEVMKNFTTGNIIQSNSKMPFVLYKKDYLPGDNPKSYQRLYGDEKAISMQLCCPK
jgi:hypothetical protein